MKFLRIIALSFIATCSFGQVNIIRLDSSSLPKQIKYIGHIINAVKWTDNNGAHYVITTETGKIESKTKEDEGLFDAFLYAYHYIVENGSTKLVWKIYDFNKECGLDLDFYFNPKMFAVTDLDKNGIAEVWIMYKNSCHGDVSPVPTKIIMYEGTKKYVLRGESRVKVSQSTYVGGNFTLDNNFKNGQSFFRQYAVKLWTKNKNETWQR